MIPLTLDKQIAEDLKSDFNGTLPSQAQFEKWAQSALLAYGFNKSDVEISLRICTANEIKALNSEYRGSMKATNVLSLPVDFPEEANIPLLGDIIICARIVEEEAKQQHKSAESHWAHMTVHSIFHLLGLDHISDDEADIMEALETKVLIGLGYNDPYL